MSLPVSHLTPLTHSRHLRGSSCSVPSLRHFPPFLPRSVSEGNAKRSARYAHPRSRLRRVRRWEKGSVDDVGRRTGWERSFIAFATRALHAPPTSHKKSEETEWESETTPHPAPHLIPYLTPTIRPAQRPVSPAKRGPADGEWSEWCKEWTKWAKSRTITPKRRKIKRK